MKGKFVIESFWQKESNCVAIVLIKASLLRYGLRGVFQKKKLKDHLLIQLQNKELYALSETEIKELNRKNKISFRKPKDVADRKKLKQLQEFVSICFAVMIRRLQVKGFAGKEYSKEEAIELLTEKGMNTDHIHELLGLTRKTKVSHYLSKKDLSRFKNKRSVLLYSDSHIAVSSEGYFDNYGKAEELNGNIPLLEKRKARGWFELK